MTSPATTTPAPGLAVGLGLRPGRPAEHILAVLDAAFPVGRIACLATIDRRAGEPGLCRAAERLGVPLLGFDAAQLANVQVPNSSSRVMEVFGIPGVAEAAALLAGSGPLLVPRRVVSGVVIAAAATRGAEEITGVVG
ncbi:cobalamin biosynthesis protein [Nocardia speluncae]|uniref:Cobalamin biosynthesis protein n=1 Tax=Nocardia speluncae TaxID=419477 RepID=A0A846XIU1_9NOCA|nr:cobalamin biosynthesis protein [Nocardia speluncae]NKY35179.1 cobalamin biosynthesis protein [Nocardia speluncae]